MNRWCSVPDFRAAPRCHVVHLDSFNIASSLDSTKHVIRCVFIYSLMGNLFLKLRKFCGFVFKYIVGKDVPYTYASTVYTIPVNRLPPYVLYITWEQIPNQTFLCSLYLVYIIIVNSFSKFCYDTVNFLYARPSSKSASVDEVSVFK